MPLEGCLLNAKTHDSLPGRHHHCHFQMEELRLSELGDLFKATVSKISSCHLSSTYSVLDTRQRDLCILSYLTVISTLCLPPEAV